MGQSTPTTTMALDTFEQRYSAFRSELTPREQKWFDELVCRARRHSNAINRRPSLDFERPVILSMMLEGLRELEDTRRELARLRSQLEEACHALADAGLVTRPRPAADEEELLRLGQAKIVEDATKAEPGARPSGPCAIEKFDLSPPNEYPPRRWA